MVDPRPAEEDDSVYRCLVVDSGPIIRLTGVSALWKKAKSFYTVPAVLQEIRDAKARHHLDNLPFELQVKEPSSEALKLLIEFARKTGDYQSLSAVDLHVLALVYDLEKEGCHGDMGHIRKVPKRMAGVGKVEFLGEKHKSTDHDQGDVVNNVEPVDDDENQNDHDPESDDDDDSDDSSQAEKDVLQNPENEAPKIEKGPLVPRSWAALVNPALASPQVEINTTNVVSLIGTQPKFSIITDHQHAGQFSDAEEDAEDATEKEINVANPRSSEQNNKSKTLQQELELEFPSLQAAVTVPYDGSDKETQEIDEEERKRRSLQPISKSGRLYTSVPVAKKLARRNAPVLLAKDASKQPLGDANQHPKPETGSESENPNNAQSRIMGGADMSGQQVDVEDDGEGWITTTSEIQSLKASGALDPMKGNKLPGASAASLKQSLEVPVYLRAACATTDFAMQNVLLQMGLELLSVDGMKIKKIKSWVRRCGACYKVYTDAGDTGPIAGKRLFCEHCGSDMIQRVACSVDGKTGKIRLHLKKHYQHNLRGTKFSLPKPGSGDRFKGDLLLREDQLLGTGTWNQRAKMCSGGKAKAASESIFGRDIAKTVGCHVNTRTGDDIQVGFGRRNPNAAKGRERRGKKKKVANKACGLRRY